MSFPAKSLWTLSLLACLLMATPALAKERKKKGPPAAQKRPEPKAFMAEGHEPGTWTQDLNAAVAYAKEKKLPVLLNFTGSDWCGYCIKMDEAVFSKSAFKAFAKTGVALVALDFPQTKKHVSTDTAKRNIKLKQKYEVEGYPTFILVDPESGRELGRLSAKQNTPAVFIAALKELSQYTSAALKDLATRNPEGKATVEAYLETSKKIQTLKKELETTTQAEESLRGNVQDLIIQDKAKKLGGEKGKKFLAAYTKKKAAEKALTEWLATDPERNPTTAAKYNAMIKHIQDAMAEMEEF